MNDQNNLQITASYKALRDQDNLLVSLQSNQVAIIAPTSGQTNFPVGGNYQWTKLLEYDYYQVQTASSDTFSPLIEDTIVKAEQLASTLNAATGYWIRIKAKQIKGVTPDPTPDPEITGVTISPSTATVVEGETLTLTGEVQGIGAYNEDGTWSESPSGTIPFTVVGNDITFNPADGSAGGQSEFIFTADGDNSQTASRTITVTEASSYVMDDSVAGDFQALQDLYTVTDGDNWTTNTGWQAMTAQTMGDAFGITTNAQGRVTDIVLIENNLVNYQLDAQGDPVLDAGGHYQLIAGRELKDTIGNLQQLQHIAIQQNRLTGNIPDSFYTLSNLEYAFLGYKMTSDLRSERWPYPRKSNYTGNKFTGSLPPEIGNLTSLKRLYLDRNHFTGTSLPSEIGQLTNLEHLSLNYNGFNGSLPSSLGNLSNIEVLHLSGSDTYRSKEWGGTVINEGNSMGGAIPAEIGQLSNLRTLRIPFHRFTGGFPLSFANLSNMSTFIAENALSSGDFPNHINNDNNPKMTTFFVPESNLTGTIDPDWNGSNLDVFTIVRNSIEGSLPTCFTDSTDPNFNTKLKMFTIQENLNMTGGWADTIESWYRPRRITMHGNNFSGPLPSVFPVYSSPTSGERLQALTVANNSFSGSIPVGLGAINSDFQLAFGFSNNNFSGYESGAISPVVTDSGDNYVSGLRCLDGFRIDGNDLPQSALDQIILDLWANVESRLGTPWENTGYLNISNQSTGAVPSNTTEINTARQNLIDNGWSITAD